MYDEVVLLEWDPADGEYTGREIEGFIEYMTAHEQKKGFVVLSIRQTGRSGA